MRLGSTHGCRVARMGREESGREREEVCARLVGSACPLCPNLKYCSARDNVMEAGARGSGGAKDKGKAGATLRCAWPFAEVAYNRTIDVSEAAEKTLLLSGSPRHGTESPALSPEMARRSSLCPTLCLSPQRVAHVISRAPPSGARFRVEVTELCPTQIHVVQAYGSSLIRYISLSILQGACHNGRLRL